MSAWTVPSWADIKAGWSSGWKALAEQAAHAYGTAAQVDPTGSLVRVQVFLQALADSRAALDRIAGKLPDPPVTAADQADLSRAQALERRYHELAAGLYADATPAPGQGTGPPPGSPVVGVAPVFLVVGAVAVSAAGVAWAIAATEYPLNLREQTALAERELDARIAAGAQGRTLQPSTLPPQADPVDKAASAAKGVGLLFVGGLVVATGAFVLPALLRK